MGMHDTFKPENDFRCPVCNDELEVWQSKDLNCLLHIWTEGEMHPTGSSADPENLGEEYFDITIEVEEFMIYSFDCGCPHPTFVKCYVKNSIWLKSELFTGAAEDRKLYASETRENYKKRIKWLISQQL